MSLALKRAKVYFKLGAMALVAILVLLLIYMNSSNTADIWFFGAYEDINVLWLVLITAISSVIIWWGIRQIFRVLRELRQVREQRIKEELEAQHRRMAEELAERERRIDEKIRKSISGTEGPQPPPKP